MQTTGLFSSSSPQQANVGGGSSLIGTLGAALVLVFGVVLLTGPPSTVIRKWTPSIWRSLW